MKNFKRKVKQITGRSRGITLERMIQELNEYLKGWIGYYKLAETPTVFSDLDCWIRRRLRSVMAKQWFKSCKARFRGLHELGVDPKQAAITAVTRRGPWAMSNMKAFKVAMPNTFFAERGALDPLWTRTLNSQVGSNRRIRTRMSGGVGGRRP